MSRSLAATAAWAALSAASVPAPAPADAGPAVRVVRTGGVRADAAALLFGAPDAGALRTALAAFSPLPGDSSKGVAGARSVQVVLEIAGPDLLAVEPPEPTRAGDGALRRVQTVDVALYALGGDAALRASVSTQIEIDLDRAPLDSGGLRWTTVLTLSPGDHRLRALVRVGPPSMGAAEAAERRALGLTTLVVSLPEAERAWFGSPRFDSATGGDGWIAVDTPAATARAVTPPARPVLTLDRPSALPWTPLDSSSDLSGLIDQPTARPRLEAWSLLSPQRRVTWSVERTVERSGATATVRPSDLAPGWARVRWVVGAVEGPPVDVWLEPAPSGDEPALRVVEAWPAHGDPGEDRPQAELVAGGIGADGAHGANGGVGETTKDAAPVRTVRLSRPRLSALRNEWRKSLTTWTSGQEAEAEAMLATTLDRELIGPRPVAHEELAAAFLRWLREAGEDARPGWLSVIALHDRVYERAIDRRRYLVAAYARRVSWAIASVLPLEIPTTRPALAAYFTHFAGRAFARYGDSGFATEALDAALALEPQRSSARIIRALELERRGQSRAAVEVLRPLLEASIGTPAAASAGQSSEGAAQAADEGTVSRGEIELRFRLASTRAGLGSEAEIHRDLDRLSSEPGWIGALAAQERWRLAVGAKGATGGRGTSGQAAEISAGLEAARAAHPGDEKLALLAAWHARRRDRDAGAEATTAAIAPTSSAIVGPRRRLGERPGERDDEALRRDAEAFANAERAGRVALADALGRMPR